MIQKRYEDMSLEELRGREEVLENMIAQIGERYDSLSGLEFTEFNGEMYNTKQLLGDRINSFYSSLGGIYAEIGKRNERND